MPPSPENPSARAVGAPSAVVIVNTGTPAAPRSTAVRHFLARFLADPRVIELPRMLWLPLLYGLVLPLRARRSAQRYRLIWQSGGSPLLCYGSQLRDALERELSADTHALRIEQAFLYSAPLLESLLDTLRDHGVRRLLIVPLFPQSSGTTTGAIVDQVGRALRRWRTLPELRQIADYCAEPAYIAALAASVRQCWREHPGESHLLMSFHGIPERYVRQGDHYSAQCAHTAALLAAALELTPQQWSMSYQSRFGAARWLSPATASVLHEMPRRGVKAVTVVCPGFPIDCLETLEEIALEGRGNFLKSGGERFDYVPALNSSDVHARLLADLIRRSAADWR